MQIGERGVAPCWVSEMCPENEQGIEIESTCRAPKVECVFGRGGGMGRREEKEGRRWRVEGGGRGWEWEEVGQWKSGWD